MIRVLPFVVACAALTGCPDPVGDDADAGTEGEGEGSEGEGEGAEGEGEGEGEGDVRDAGPLPDGGNGFDLGSLLDAGPLLDCLPDELPELSLAGAFDALGLGLYLSGDEEDGVRCGVDPRVTCDDGVPCCTLCGYGACAGLVDGGPSCPAFTTPYACDGEEDCAGNDVCCFTLSGTECRPEAECAFDVSSAIGQFLGDGGITFPDAGVVDGGFVDGGFVATPIDGGLLPDDAGFADGGFVDVGVDGGPGPVPDAGSLLDGLQATLEQGVPVCTSSFFDCELLSGEACCTSDRLVAVDVGFCLPALLCAGDLLP